MQRAVIDANIWVSGLIWHGSPRVLVQRILSRQLHSIVSSEMVAEFRRVLNYPRISNVLLKRGLVAVDLAMQIRLGKA
jgi:putative PIN family toxin of toxin-antitoxin system